MSSASKNDYHACALASHIHFVGMLEAHLKKHPEHKKDFRVGAEQWAYFGGGKVIRKAGGNRLHTYGPLGLIRMARKQMEETTNVNNGMMRTFRERRAHFKNRKGVEMMDVSTSDIDASEDEKDDKEGSSEEEEEEEEEGEEGEDEGEEGENDGDKGEANDDGNHSSDSENDPAYQYESDGDEDGNKNGDEDDEDSDDDGEGDDEGDGEGDGE